MDSPNIVGGITGGLLIGMASVLMFYTSGRIAGISGILSGLYGNWSEPDRIWRLVFFLGLISGAGLISLLTGGLELDYQSSGFPLLLAGLLVGFGTQLGSGCTSGHGICGIARWSKRSISATLIFISTAMLTVYTTRHLLS